MRFGKEVGYPPQFTRPFLAPALERVASDTLPVLWEQATVPVDAEPVCDVREARCRCHLPPGHGGFHECDPATCGGRWEVVDGQFHVVRLPRVGGYSDDDDPGPTFGEVVAGMLGFTDDEEGDW